VDANDSSWDFLEHEWGDQPIPADDKTAGWLQLRQYGICISLRFHNVEWNRVKLAESGKVRSTGSCITAIIRRDDTE
jgi:hypothetical protein